MSTHWMPREMRIAPQLDPIRRSGRVRRRYALLVSPFYPKEPHASFGKHVLTPTLALTAVAAATPETWDVSYWDENLLQGAPPCDPLPEVVGISVHLTFANRAFEPRIRTGPLVPGAGDEGSSWRAAYAVHDAGC